MRSENERRMRKIRLEATEDHIMCKDLSRNKHPTVHSVTF